MMLEAHYSEQDRKLAYVLYVELSSRIATQHLPPHSGVDAAALQSLYTLFGIARAALTDIGPNASNVAPLVLEMLNEDIRPVTGFWTDKGFRGLPQDLSFRKDLVELQKKLRRRCEDFGRIARNELPTTVSGPEFPHGSEMHSGTGASATFGASAHLRKLCAADQILSVEKDSVLARRDEFGVPDSQGLIGVALSGGGIRAATFAMGVLQSLSTRGLYRHFDYLSTVSGGGYTGALLSTWAASRSSDEVLKIGPFVKPHPEPKFESEAEAPPDAKSGSYGFPSVDPPVVRFVRDRTGYLLDGGLWGLLPSLARVMGGVVGAAATLLALVGTTWFVAQGGRWVLDRAGWAEGFCAILGFVVFLYGRSSPRPQLSTVGSLSAGVLATGLGVLGLGVLVGLTEGLSTRAEEIVDMGGASGLLVTSGGAGLLVSTGGMLARFAGSPGGLLGSSQLRRRLALFALWASPTLAFVLALLAFDAAMTFHASNEFVLEHWLSPQMTLGAVVLGTSLVISLLVDVNRQSLRVHYQERLARTFCVRVSDQEVISSDPSSKLSELNRKAPFHIFNITTNLPSSRDRNLLGRKSMYTSICRAGMAYPKSVSTDSRIPKLKKAWAVWESSGADVSTEGEAPTRPAADESIDVATAMAISGAAVTPMMGPMSVAGVAPWLTLLNFRLGYWAKNPNYSGWRRHLAAPNGWYLLKEMMGWGTERDARIQLTDGGHYENLGIYALLERRCPYIIAVDAESDPDARFDGFTKLARMAKIDLGVDITIDLSRVGPGEDGYSDTPVAVGEINYGGGATGLLVYLRLTLSDGEPRYVTAYREAHPRFPWESIADQFYDEAQFEAYRALGEHVGNTLFGEAVGEGAYEREVVEPGPWFEALRDAFVARPSFEEAGSSS